MIAAAISLAVGFISSALLPESAHVIWSFVVPMVSDWTIEVILLRKHGYVTQ